MAYIIEQANCSACHRCRVECPVEAIRIKNTKYWIDSEKCIGCGNCENVCHNACISNPDKPKPAASPHEKILEDCDVLVIGGGAAGIVAAARAATKGKKVVVLEKNHEVGGSAWYAHMFTPVYSKWHEKLGVADARDRKFNTFMKHIPETNGKLLRRLLDANVDFLNWLIDEHDLGDDFYLSAAGSVFGGPVLISTYEEPYNKKRIDTAIGPGSHGWFLINKLLGIIEQNGGKVYYNAAAQKLLTDDTGTVTGALACDAGGEIVVSAKAVVVATGSFTRDHELMDRMQPLFYEEKPGREPVHVFTCSTCTGDGIKMCEELGADIDYVNRRVNLFGPMHHPFPAVGLTGSRGNSVTLNSDGTRYIPSKPGMQEVSDLAHTISRRAWNVTTKAYIAEAIGKSIGKQTDVVGIPMDEMYTNWEYWMELEERDGGCVSANTLEELAVKTGMNLENLKQSIETFNDGCKNPAPSGPPPGDGEEESIFNMPMPKPKPIHAGPYYAFFMKLFHENAVGGMTVDENTSVLRGGDPIPGLYAAGDTTRGVMVSGELGVGLVETTLTALTAATCSGYIAGIEAANYAEKK